ncbi:MAG: VWA domain-containing protein [Spirochaetaceae bacterium]|nr:VWA domain-containing protein [Spirochaetaceae bacterium]MBQ8560210.1 VWA domain-containing protein [Spirochaetaceae bacterium]
MKRILITFALISCYIQLFAGGSIEGGGSNRGSYLSSGGFIILPHDIQVEAYLSERDYNYPPPTAEAVSITTGTGSKDGFQYLLLGLKGKKEPFNDVPPLNISFCIDRSGSMSSVMPWVKDSFYIFIDSIRNGDVVSLVDMNSVAQVLVPPTKINSKRDREHFKRQVDKIQANGSTDVYSGIKKSYEQIQEYNGKGYISRVIIMTDGMHNFGEMINKDIVELAQKKSDEGVNISTILLGIQTGTGLMTDVAIQGGGSSRFVSNHDEMVRIFNTELDRLLVPVVRNMEITLELADGVKLDDTWGYQHSTNGSTIQYKLPTLHNGDYETVLARVKVDKTLHDNEIGTFNIVYSDLFGQTKKTGPHRLLLPPHDNDMIQDIRVREVEGIVAYTDTLRNIAEKAQKINALEHSLFQYQKSSPQYDDVVEQIKVESSQCRFLIKTVRDYLTKIEDSLGRESYQRYYDVLESYEDSFLKLDEAYP